MLSKKQYIIMLIAASFVFLAIFAASYIYTVTTIPPVVTEEHEQISSETSYGEEQNKEEVVVEVINNTDPVTILPSTQVMIRMLDQNNNIVSEQEIESKSLLGLGEKEINTMFRGYDIVQFDSNGVVLEKVQYIEPVPKGYRLGVENGEIGIITEGDTEVFTTLGLSTKDFSKRTNMLIMEGGIKLTAIQKNNLDQDPHYIEYILQTFSE